MEDNIKINLQETRWTMEWTDLVQNRDGQVVGSCECGNEPSVSMKYEEFLD